MGRRTVEKVDLPSRLPSEYLHTPSMQNVFSVSHRSGPDREKNPISIMPMYGELRPISEKARSLAPSNEVFIFNAILNPRDLSEFAGVNATGKVLRRGR